MFEYNGSRIAFSFLGIEVYWYGILIVAGMLLATILSARELKRRGGDEDIIYDLALWILPAAIIGARIYYVIFEFDKFNNIIDMINIRDGGLAIYGGVIAGVIVGYILAKKKNLSFFKISDIIAIFIPLAQSIGRWGNFLNNEAHGGPTDLPWALIIDGKKYHPTFFYESLGNFIIFAILYFYVRNKNTKPGTETSIYLIGYGVLRFFVEGLRTDSLWWGPIRVSQLVSIIFIVIGLVILYINREKNRDKFITVKTN